MTDFHALNWPAPGGSRPERVAIAGTITNAVTHEVIPRAVVRITAAPEAFAERLMAILTSAIAHQPHLQAQYQDLLESWNRSLASLATAQLLFDRLGPVLGLARLDETQAGGDGHYCFCDLPPGLYTLVASYTWLNHCHGSTSAQAEIAPNCHQHAFVELDMALSLAPGSWPLTVIGHPQHFALASGAFNGLPNGALTLQARDGNRSR
ncbi:hypothetical protein IQ254_01565 [Nodosilinea sp. LEGE 07088]|uniref:hypothetical protein n=1 Tax=Nodosilinea sp. LEGE 07088 TaxID=2777968 RepID=UPI001880C9F2|nr:hypothetical protein [Nodosilinea sp. LEGE 07088]MBE9135902.1 hypothetical protein [Nodosilinea sp. LEGE 07088]